MHLTTYCKWHDGESGNIYTYGQDVQKFVLQFAHVQCLLTTASYSAVSELLTDIIFILTTSTCSTAKLFLLKKHCDVFHLLTHQVKQTIAKEHN